MSRSASRMAARSTTQGTPVKSWSSTRAGLKLISCAGAPIFHAATYSMSPGLTVAPFSVAQQIFEQDLDGIRDAGEVGAALLQRFEREVPVLTASDGQGRSSTKAIGLWHLVLL